MQVEKFFSRLKNKNLRSTIILIAGVLIIFSIFSYFVFLSIKNAVKDSIKNQQYALVSSIAREIDEKVTSDLKVISEVSKRITPGIITNEKLAQNFINNRPGTSAVFPNGIFILSKSGKLVAEYSKLFFKRELDHSGKEYYKNCVSTLAPSVSCIFNQEDRKSPLLVYSAPILDKFGRLAGLICGEIDFYNESVFKKAITSHIGKKGYLYILSKERYLILHPDSTRIFTKVLPGANRLLDSAINGFEGTDETINSKGIFYLTSFKELKSVPWILAANFPGEEAYLPVYKAEEQIIISILITLVLISVILYFVLVKIRKEVERRIGTEEYSNILLSSAGEGILGVDALGSCTFINNAALTMLGYDEKKEILGRKICGSSETAAVGLPATDESEIPIFKYSNKDSAFEGEEEVSKPNESTSFSIAYKYAPISKDGQNKGAVITFEDITRKKEIAEELKTAKVAADAANKAKSEFLANMSHEIRTPMNSIIGFSELLYNSLEDNKQKSQADAIKRSSKNLLRIINDILDLSKIEAGRIVIEVSEMNPHTVVRDMESLFSSKISEKELELIISEEAGLPPAIMFDEVRLRQILFNLIGNAIKFTEKGAVKVSIKKKNKDQNHIDLFISVTDTGIGIPEKEQELIFEAFTQQQGQSIKKYGGTGLGLTITKKLIEMMGGTLKLTSEVNKGSRFDIAFFNVETAEGTQAASFSKNFDIRSVEFEKATVLICDDIVENRKFLVDLLSDSPITTIEAENGLVCVELAGKQLPDLIFMDLRMPEMDGYEATKILKKAEETKNIPIVAMSASVIKEYDTGKSIFDDYLMKPLEIRTLIEVTMKYLRHKVIEKENVHSKEKYFNFLFTVNEEQKKNLPQIIETLEKTYMPVYQEAVKKQIIDSMGSFGREISLFGEKVNLPPLKEFGEMISFYADNIEINNLLNTLKIFPSLIQRLKDLQSV